MSKACNCTKKGICFWCQIGRHDKCHPVTLGVWYASTQAEYAAAIKEAKKAGGGTIKLGPGTFDSLPIPNNTTIVGTKGYQ